MFSLISLGGEEFPTLVAAHRPPGGALVGITLNLHCITALNHENTHQKNIIESGKLFIVMQTVWSS